MTKSYWLVISAALVSMDRRKRAKGDKVAILVASAASLLKPWSTETPETRAWEQMDRRTTAGCPLLLIMWSPCRHDACNVGSHTYNKGCDQLTPRHDLTATLHNQNLLTVGLGLQSLPRLDGCTWNVMTNNRPAPFFFLWREFIITTFKPFWFLKHAE